MPDYGGEDPYGEPDTQRRDTKTLHFTKYEWPDGLRLHRYDDGSVKIAWNNYQAKVTSVRNHEQGQPGGHVIVEFSPFPQTGTT